MVITTKIETLLNSDRYKIEINGVRVDFICKYKYPYFLHRYKGYALKNCSSIGKEEIKQSKLIRKEGYLPIFVVNLDEYSNIGDTLEKRKSHLGFTSVTLEIEKDLLDLKKFKGVALVNITKGNSPLEVATCIYNKIENDKIIVEGFSGTFNNVIERVLLIYNSKITRIWR